MGGTRARLCAGRATRGARGRLAERRGAHLTCAGNDRSFFGGVLAVHGDGVYHLAFRVADIDASERSLSDAIIHP